MKAESGCRKTHFGAHFSYRRWGPRDSRKALGSKRRMKRYLPSFLTRYFDCQTTKRAGLSGSPRESRPAPIKSLRLISRFGSERPLPLNQCCVWRRSERIIPSGLPVFRCASPPPIKPHGNDLKHNSRPKAAPRHSADDGQTTAAAFVPVCFVMVEFVNI